MVGSAAFGDRNNAANAASLIFVVVDNDGVRADVAATALEI